MDNNRLLSRNGKKPSGSGRIINMNPGGKKQLRMTDDEKIRQAIIQPHTIQRDPNKKKLETDYKAAETGYIDKSGKDKKNWKYGSTIQNYWKGRTNDPYKVILVEENFKKDFKSDKDLIVHRVTQADKDSKKVTQAYIATQENMEKHNNELQMIYSTDKKNEHLKKFQYTNVYRYKCKTESKDHDEMKKDTVAYYKDKQKKEEESKQNRDQVLSSLINNNIFDKDELLEFGAQINISKKEEQMTKEIDDKPIITTSNVDSVRAGYMLKKKNRGK